MVDFGLYFDELGVFAVLFHEFFVGSTFDHFALFHHDEAAGVAQGEKPARNGESDSRFLSGNNKLK